MINSSRENDILQQEDSLVRTKLRYTFVASAYGFGHSGLLCAWISKLSFIIFGEL